MRSAHARARVARTIVALGLLIVPLAATPRLVAAVGTGTWKQQLVQGQAIESLGVLELHCPSVTVCYALRGAGPGPGAPRLRLQKTSDGGKTWTTQQLDAQPPGIFISDRLACPGVDRCYLLVNTGGFGPSAHLAIWSTADGGTTWAHHAVEINGELNHISCPSATVCYVSAFVGATGMNTGPSAELLVTRDGGQTWAATTLTISNQPFFALTCPGIDDCYFIAFVNADVQPGGPAMRAKGIAATHDGGRTWVVHTGETETSPGYFSLSCPTRTQCFAFGEAGVAATDDGGRTWKKLPARGLDVQSPPLESKIVCSTPLTCYIAAGQLWRTVDGGTTWTEETSESLIGVQALACPAVSICYGANGPGVLLKTTDGETWQELTPRPLDLRAIACPGADTCYAMGGSGTVVTTTDDGATWVRRSAGAKNSLSSFFSVACPTLRTCLAIEVVYSPGGPAPQTRVALLRTTDGGLTWREENTGTNTSPGPALACPTRTVCFDVGGYFGSTSLLAMLRSTDAGQTWSTVGTLPQQQGLSALACANTMRCVGVGGVSPCMDDLVRLHESAANAVLRPSQQGCAEAGWLFDTRDGGRHWHRDFRRTLAPYVALGADLVTAACPTPTQCYAGGYGLWLRSTHGGRNWVTRYTIFPNYDAPPPDQVGPSGIIQSLSCTSVSTCWGVALRLNSVSGIPVRTTDGGRHWRAVDANVPLPNQYAPADGGVQALACPRTNRCYAVGGNLIMAYEP